MGKVEKSQQGSTYYIPRKEFLGKSHNFLWGDLSLKMEWFSDGGGLAHEVLLQWGRDARCMYKHVLHESANMQLVSREPYLACPRHYRK